MITRPLSDRLMTAAKRFLASRFTKFLRKILKIFVIFSLKMLTLYEV
jgi:hypothetical protein